MQLTGYPSYLVYIISLVGIVFIIWRPKYNFWFALLYFSARELRTSAMTRIGGLGPYFNLDDLILVILIISSIRNSQNNGIKIPIVVVWLLISFIFSVLMINLYYEFSYGVQREHKGALYFILALFYGYNFVYKEKDLEIFLKMLFVGSILASLQYLFVTQDRIQSYDVISIQESIRSVGYIGLIPTFIIVSVFIKINRPELLIIRILYIVGLSLMTVNLILSQTRSLYISILLTIIILLLLYKGVRVKFSLLFTFIITAFLVYLIFDQYLGFININEVIFGRLQLLANNQISDNTTIGRLTAIAYELEAFLNSNIILGKGLGSTYFLPEGYNPSIAWGHVGHIAYLARLGLVGFLIYSIFIPFKALNFILKIKKDNQLVYTNIFFIFSTALIISDWIGAWMSGSYLGINSFLSGTVIGTTWACKDKRIKMEN